MLTLRLRYDTQEYGYESEAFVQLLADTYSAAEFRKNMPAAEIYSDPGYWEVYQHDDRFPHAKGWGYNSGYFIPRTPEIELWMTMNAPANAELLTDFQLDPEIRTALEEETA